MLRMKLQDAEIDPAAGMYVNIRLKLAKSFILGCLWTNESRNPIEMVEGEMKSKIA